MILVDTSALVLSLSADRPQASKLYGFLERGERLALPALVLYEWKRGPRDAAELAVQEDLFPSERAVPFDHRAAAVAAELYLRVKGARQRSVDLAIAATAIAAGAALWTANPRDFSDIPGLELV